MLKFIMDLENKKWITSGEADEEITIVDFFIDMNPKKTKFKNFDYFFFLEGPGTEGYQEEDDSVLILPEDLENLPNQTSPEDGTTVFPFLSNRHFLKNLKPDSLYIFDLTFKNMREIITDSFTFITPKPKPPYSDWVWDTNKLSWEPPVPMPNPVWNSDLKQWELPK